jgi:hypothetical protein
MCPAPPPSESGVPPSPPSPPFRRGLGRAAAGLLIASIGLLVVVGALGPSAAVPRFPAGLPWPPYFAHVRPPELLAAMLAWLAVGLGGAGLVVALLAARRGWRPSPRKLIVGCLLAVIALVVIPPVGSNDMLDYAVYGRIAALGHSPYRETPARLAATGDPVGRVAPVAWRNAPSVYGPLATASEQAASQLAGTSAARTIFWLKVWNGLAYLAVVLALDRVLRSDPAGRVRAHLLWSVNPLMLLAVLAGGHIDGLAAAAGFVGLLALRRLGAARGLAAGVLVGAAVATKASFALYLVGVAWAARRSPRTLAAAALGLAAVLVPSYVLSGRAALRAVVSRATGVPDVYQPWHLLTGALGLTGIGPVERFDNTAGLIAFVILAAVLLWRMPAGPPGLAFAGPALAVSLAWLVCSPQQRPWFDAMIFPLLALLPATRLDWVVAFRAVVASAAELPGAVYFGLRPHWLMVLSNVVSRYAAPPALAAAAAVLLWLCVTRRWTQLARPALAEPLPEAGHLDRRAS